MAADQSTDVTTAKPAKRFRILLTVSLALNLLFIGILGGAAWRGGPPQGGGGRVAGLGNFAAPYVRALPREDRKALQSELRRQHPQMGRAARRGAYQQMIEALRRTPFDRAAVVAVLDEQSRLGAQVLATGQAAWLERIEAMDAAQRQDYATRLQDRLARRSKRKP